MPRPSTERRCRCGSRRKLGRCCGPYIAGEPAPTPEELMRSRYSAYALGEVAYIQATTDPDGPQWRTDCATWTDDIERFCMSTRFEGLEVIDTPRPSTSRGSVTFRARMTQSGHDVSFTEKSLFVRGPDGRWRYHSGERVP